MTTAMGASLVVTPRNQRAVGAGWTLVEVAKIALLMFVMMDLKVTQKDQVVVVVEGKKGGVFQGVWGWLNIATEVYPGHQREAVV